MTRKIQLIAVLLVLFLGLGLVLNIEKGQAKAPEEGSIVPQFVLKDLQENTVSLRHVYSRNKVTIINFWATWCPPCRKEIPDFNRLYNRKRYLIRKNLLLIICKKQPTTAIVRCPV